MRKRVPYDGGNGNDKVVDAKHAFSDPDADGGNAEGVGQAETDGEIDGILVASVLSTLLRSGHVGRRKKREGGQSEVRVMTVLILSVLTESHCCSLTACYNGRLGCYVMGLLCYSELIWIWVRGAAYRVGLQVPRVDVVHDPAAPRRDWISKHFADNANRCRRRTLKGQMIDEIASH